MTALQNTADNIDGHVDIEIAACLDLSAPRSFFLFAGAGSGKTRSLVNALEHLRHKHGKELLRRGQRVAVITYTNAAADEITRRLQLDPAVFVSTIHSFAWTIIEGFTHDIREWLRGQLADDIRELEDLERRGRSGTKASATRIVQIAAKQRRLQRLPEIRRFIYSPTGDNRGRAALNHSEVIKLASHFIQTKPAMQHILINGYPIILIDESQDTNKHLVDALFDLQAAHSGSFSLGLLGDMMQRIYSDGKEGLGTGLRPDWATPVKQLNHRCPKRVVSLINKIRLDGQSQIPRDDSIEGHAHIFILPADTADKPGAEKAISRRMATLTGDGEWEAPKGYKCLTLEHRMAARRMGFLDMFVPLHEIDEFRTGLLDGTLPITRFFSANVLPLVKNQKNGFAVARLVKATSPLLADDKLKLSDDPETLLREVRDAIDSLMGLWDPPAGPTFGCVVRNIASTGLFSIPEVLRPSVFRNEAMITLPEDPDADEPDRLPARLAAIDAFLETKFEQIEAYSSYVSGTAEFDTHQGVKGLEFPRVMVIMDDTEARGFMFKYAKLFSGGAAADATSDSTRRLFYVTCSRAERALALVAYSTEPDRVRQHVLREGWFTDTEIHLG